MAWQARGGRGKSGARLRDDDSIEEVAHVMDHDRVLFFFPDGTCRSLKAYQIPQSSRTAAGAPITQASQADPASKSIVTSVCCGNPHADRYMRKQAWLACRMEGKAQCSVLRVDHLVHCGVDCPLLLQGSLSKG
jgi:DNA gyrase/topoisomerase IV subunit A